MSRIGKLTNLLRQTIFDLADNNKKRWSHFTGDAPFVYSRFCQRLIDYKITKNPDEAELIWKTFKVRGKEMQFRDFICFLQSENAPDDGENEEGLQESNQMTPTASLYANRRELIEYFLSIDPRADGLITQKQFSDFAVSHHIVNSPHDLAAILNRVNPSNDSKFNYFLLMYELSQSHDNFELKYNSSSERFNRSPFQSQEKLHVDGGRSSLDPSIFGESHPSNSNAQNHGGRRELDESIFGERSPNRPVQQQSHARGNLDPSIFGEKQEIAQVIENPPAPIDLSNAKDCTDYNPDQTISLIARIANSKFKTIRDCFGSWRGGSDRLSWDDIYRGMVNDAKIEISPEVIENLVAEYGGELTMSSFTRFISDGARLNTPEPVRAAPKPLTERDILLNKLATGLKGKPSWEVSIKNSKNSLDLVRNLKKFGIIMKSEELRSTFEELGMRKIVEEIKQRQMPPKKRGAK